MKLIAFILVLLGLNSTSTIIKAKSGDEVALINRIELLRNTMVHPDSTILKDIAADDLVYVHSSGTVRNKKSFIDEFMKGQTVITTLTFSDQIIKISGKNAIVRHHLTGDTNKKNIAGTLDIIILQVWNRQHGVWKLLARQAAKIPI